MKIGLVGPSYQERSLSFDAQRTINLYPVFDPKGKEVSALYGVPGKTLFATAGVGPGRGGFTAANGRAFAISGSGLYEVLSDGTTTLRGTLDSSSGIVSMDENGLQLGICDGTAVYVFTFATNAFAKVTDPDLPLSGTITFIDGYFVVSKNSSGSFYISALYNGSSWGALDFATAESSPDDLLRVYNAVGQLWLMGTFTSEIWTNTGASAFPFERISGAKMEVGILAPHTAIAVDNSLFWVGRDKIGSGIVYRAQGFTPQRISTNPIEEILQAAPTPSTLRAYTYQQDGHTFYVITGGGMSTTLVYDISTQLWHERAYLNSFGAYEADLVATGFSAFNKQLGISRLNGKIYSLSQDVFTDDVDELSSERIFTHLSDENKRNVFRQLEIALESGVGNAAMVSQTGQYTTSVQQFEITIAANATSATFPLNTVDVNYSAIFWEGFTTTHTGTTQREYRPRVELTNGSTVTAYRDTASNSFTITVRGTVVQFDPILVESVQHGVITVASGSATGTATINALTTSRSVALLLGNTNDTSNTSGANTHVAIDLTNTTTVTATRATAGSPVLTVGFCVVQFKSSKIASIQKRSVTLTSATTSDTDTITTVIPANCILLHNGVFCNSTTLSVYYYNLQLTNATTVTLARTSTTTTSRTINYTLVEFIPGVLLTTQRSTTAVASVTSADATISSISLASALCNLAGFSTTASAPAQVYTSSKLLNAVTVRSEKNTAGVTTSTASWEAIQFATISMARDPLITLWISRDGCRTWSMPYTTSMGKIGEYRKRAVFRRLGYAFDITFKVRITDPVKRALIGSYLT